MKDICAKVGRRENLFLSVAWENRPGITTAIVNIERNEKGGSCYLPDGVIEDVLYGTLRNMPSKEALP